MRLFEDLNTHYADQKDRLVHIEGVVAWSMKLAQHWGCDVEAMRLAAYLHDLTKPLPTPWHETLIGTHQKEALKVFPVFAYHGLSAALYAKHEYGIQDETILSAVTYHTTGRIGMNRFEKILMFADKTEPSRPYPEAEILRRQALENIDDAFVAMLIELKAYDQRLGRPINDLTIQTYRHYIPKRSLNEST